MRLYIARRATAAAAAAAAAAVACRDRTGAAQTATRKQGAAGTCADAVNDSGSILSSSEHVSRRQRSRRHDRSAGRLMATSSRSCDNWALSGRSVRRASASASAALFNTHTVANYGSIPYSCNLRSFVDYYTKHGSTVNVCVRQGRVLSPYLFACFIYSVVDNVQASGLGCHVNMACLSILLYADDILLVSVC